MVFSSPIFLFLFLPFFLIVYYLVPDKIKNWVLLLFSILFYSWGEKLIVFVMLGSTVIDFFSAQYIEKGYRKMGLTISIIANLGFLFFFKYFNFTFENFNAFLSFFDIQSEYLKNLPKIALPIGISFYTFQTLSYSIDVFRGDTKANRNFIEFATYVTMFPQLVAGPIVRYTDIAKELKKRNHNLSNFTIGVERFIVGLAKKVLLANTFAYVADEIFSFPHYSMTPSLAWLGIIAYSFQIYFDFSGYSDMAIGLGKMLGFNIPENFNYPYISKSIKEFWRRWHISLSTWFRDYLYISLGGNRVSKNRTYINLFIVFFVTGLWHGASWNFIVWGLFHGLFLVIERIGFDKILANLWLPLQHLYALLVVLIGWVFFRAETLTDAMTYLGYMFGYNTANFNFVDVGMFITYEFIITSILAILFSTPIYRNIRQELSVNSNLTTSSIYGLMSNAFTFTLLGVFFITILYVSASSYNPFIYFRF